MAITRPSRPPCHGESERMKAARLVVLTVAIASGGVAAMLAGRSDKPPEVKVAPAPQIATVDILVAKADIGIGQVVSPDDMQWQEWPAAAATGNFIRRSDRSDAIEKLAGFIARAPFVAGEPIREAKLVNSKGSGFMAAILPTGMRAISTQISPETSAGGFIGIGLAARQNDVDMIVRQDEPAGAGLRRNL